MTTETTDKKSEEEIKQEEKEKNKRIGIVVSVFVLLVLILIFIKINTRDMGNNDNNIKKEITLKEIIKKYEDEEKKEMSDHIVGRTKYNEYLRKLVTLKSTIKDLSFVKPTDYGTINYILDTNYQDAFALNKDLKNISNLIQSKKKELEKEYNQMLNPPFTFLERRTWNECDSKVINNNIEYDFQEKKLYFNYIRIRDGIFCIMGCFGYLTGVNAEKAEKILKGDFIKMEIVYYVAPPIQKKEKTFRKRLRRTTITKYFYTEKIIIFKFFNSSGNEIARFYAPETILQHNNKQRKRRSYMDCWKLIEW